MVGFLAAQLALGAALSIGFLAVLWMICPLDFVALAARGGNLGVLGAATLAGAVAPFAVAFAATALELRGSSDGQGGGSAVHSLALLGERQDACKIESTAKGSRRRSGSQTG